MTISLLFLGNYGFYEPPTPPDIPKDSTLLWIQDDDTIMDESKYMLFEKYMQDQIGVENLRSFQSNYNLNFNRSNDTISSNYPGSNSPIHDITTCSIASSFAVESPDCMKNTGDEFEIPARNNELEIQQKYNDFLNRISKNRMSYTRNLPRCSELSNISDSSLSTVISCARNSTSRSEKDFNFTKQKNTDSVYSKEYLSLAQNFGAVVTMRRPGHHTGPVRNPDCECEHCKVWNDERQAKSKGKLLLFEETPITQTAFWKKNHRNYV